jgi:serine/threonine protein kinase
MIEPHDPNVTAASDADAVEPERTGPYVPTSVAGDPTAPPRRPAEIGTVIAGRYTLVAVIGEGGMGTVYRAEQSEPVKRQVALKLIRSGMDSRTMLQRFEAERQALALMDHPNIARVYDGGTTPTGQPFFVMELVRGIPITRFCDERRLGLTARLELFVAVCQAVQHAHQKGIIHRDLKPGNVLVTEVDGRPAPKVIDFGVAKATEQKLTDESIADFGLIIGTPTYMSPEQADPSVVDIDTRTDVYALGVILYELLVGSPPFDARQFKRGAILEMLRMVREDEPPRPSTKLSSQEALPSIAADRAVEPAKLTRLLRGELDWVVMKALEKDRTRRYETVNGLARDIQRYLADEVIEARPPSTGYRLRKYVRRNRGPVLAAALVAAALLLGVIGMAWQWREAVYQRNEADRARTAAEHSAQVAQEQRKVALDAVGQLVTTVRVELIKRPDHHGALKRVLDIAQSSLDNIAQNPLVDISLNDTTRAAAHDATARMYRDLGDTPTALKEFTRAADIYQAILAKAADGPDKEVVKKNLVVVLISLGQTILRTGSQAEARGYYDRAAQLISQLDNKTASDYSKTLINLYSSLGVVTVELKPREAREHYLSALRIAEATAFRETAETGGPSDDTRLTLQRLYTLVGGAEGRLRDVKSREQYYGKAQAIAAERLRAQPDDTARKRWLANAHERIGDALLRTHESAKAAKEFAVASALFKVVAVSDPKNVDAQADLARVQYSLGLAAERNSDRGAASKHFQTSLDIRKNRVNLKTETYAQRDLMMALARTGSHREAIELAETVRTKLPKDPAALVDIACCYAVCSATVPSAGVDKETHERYVAKALEALKQAIDAGYGDKANVETEPDLDAVRNRAEFKTLSNRLPEP